MGRLDQTYKVGDRVQYAGNITAYRDGRLKGVVTHAEKSVGTGEPIYYVKWDSFSVSIKYSGEGFLEPVLPCELCWTEIWEDGNV